MEDELSRTIISRASAQKRYQQKLENINLPKVEQEEFYKRYDNFEKRVFRTSNTFYKSPKHSRSFHIAKQSITGCLTNSVFGYKKEEALSPKRTTFSRVTSHFLLPDKNKKKPDFDLSNQKGKIDITYVRIWVKECLLLDS